LFQEHVNRENERKQRDMVNKEKMKREQKFNEMYHTLKVFPPLLPAAPLAVHPQLFNKGDVCHAILLYATARACFGRRNAKDAKQ
jgi:hypothetical protein